MPKIPFADTLMVRERLAPGSVKRRHRHAQGYVAVVLSGSYVEAGDEGRRRVGPGDALVLYTDGVTEEHSGTRVFGEDRLTALLGELAGQDADGIAGRVEQAVLDFGEPEPRDDMAVLVLRVRDLVAHGPEHV